MEFEQNKQPTMGIDDATRLAASTRQLNITPIHDAITPEQIAKPATPSSVNSIPGETEVTVSVTQEQKLEQSIAKKNHRLALSVSLITMAVMSVSVYYSFMLNR